MLEILKKLGILKTDTVNEKLAPTYGEYPEMFGDMFLAIDPTIQLITYDVQNFAYPSDINEVDGYLITGSAVSVYEDLDWLKELGTFIKKLHQHKKKIIGVCFGHQLIAHVLGGKTVKSDKGWGIGVRSVELNEAGRSFTKKKGPFNLFYSHQDQVVVPAKGSKLLASSSFCPIAMCSIGDHIFTFQGHIEMPTEYTHQLMNMRRHKYGEPLYQEAKATLKDRNDKYLVTQWIIDFIWGE